jgi:ubiquinone biosynthesis protein
LVPDKSFGFILVSLSKASSEAGLKLLPDIPLLAGVFFNMERCALILDPKLDSLAYLESHLVEISRGHVAKALSPQNLFHNAVEIAELIEKLPAKVSRILDAVAANELKVTVHAVDEEVLIKGFQKVANRIALALILAALILGAALLMQVRTSFSICGYPGLAMLCFMAAAFFAFTLVVEIMISDRR